MQKSETPIEVVQEEIKVLGRGARHSLPLALLGAVGVALLMTILSTWLYVASGTSTLDLSRPGYERQREEVTTNLDTDKTFSSSGPMSQVVLDEFLAEYDKRTKEIENFGNFNSSSLDDSELQLAP